MWGILEIRLTEWIQEMHGMRNPVIQILVVKKALEFEPKFTCELLKPDFKKLDCRFISC